MKLSKLLIVLVIVIWLSSAVTYVLYKGYYRESIINEFDMDVEIIKGGFVGLNVDTDAIHFGVVTLGGGSIRGINLSNNKDYDVFIYLTRDDSELSSIVNIDPNYFILKSSEERRVKVSIYPPEDFPVGNFTGKIQVIEKVPFYRKI